VGTHWPHRGNDVRIEPFGTDQRKRWPGGTVVPTRRTRVVSNQDPNDAALADLVYGETEEDAGVGSQPSMSTSSSKPPGAWRSHRDRGGQYRDQHAAGRHDVSVSARAEFGACAPALNAIQARQPSQGSNLP
jgi:hypothetical protein